MKRQIGLLSLAGLLLLAGCDTSNPMLQPTPAQVVSHTPTKTTVISPSTTVTKPVVKPIPKPVKN